MALETSHRPTTTPPPVDPSARQSFLLLRQNAITITDWLKQAKCWSSVISVRFIYRQPKIVPQMLWPRSVYLQNGEERNMQLHGEPDLQASQAEPAALSPRKRDPLVTRRVTIRLTEKLHEQLEAATKRRGVGKSMIVEAALERFLSPRLSVEELVRERFDEMDTRFDRLEHDIRMLAETVALHARYHFSAMPQLPQSQQREARIRGDERFKVLAEQVDRRIRLRQPLLQETIDRLNAAKLEGPGREAGEGALPRPEPRHGNQRAASEEVVDNSHESSAAAGEGGSISNFRYLPNPFCWPA